MLGPTNRTASLSPDVNDPGGRNITFVALVDAYREAMRGLLAGGVDLIMIETVFDTLNAKAAIYAIETEFQRSGVRVPVMVSGTITDASGRTLSGQTPGSVLDFDRPCGAAHRRAQLRARRRAAAAARRVARTRRRVATSACIPMRACRTSSADTTSRRRTWRA